MCFHLRGRVLMSHVVTVADDGYGVSYIIVGEEMINFHVSSKHSCSETNDELGQTYGIKNTSDVKDMMACSAGQICHDTKEKMCSVLTSCYDQNGVIKGVYPASPSSWLFVVIAILATMYMRSDPSMGLITKIQQHLPLSLHVSLSAQGQTMLSALLFSTLLWLSLILALRFCLKLLLSYHQWMFEQHGRVSNTTKIWVTLLRLLSSRKPLLYSYQTSLPHLPVPVIKRPSAGTCCRLAPC
ncbi:hypothetical protein CgunFtcFv8_009129 [Champsocephalus gunnari]|uniref:Uncharacterized protein n=1 Tax=Champsocephalus gunnari TaxID=52237 RepID=A0AAN8D576_CHAGU|nr:hypothetical protein CgunFtcFv8_009129 [Champsocephalus gunnari]